MEKLDIKLDAFEGPFDVLYSLIEKNKIDIYDIPISELTDQYMEYLTSLNNRSMDTMSEFMLMAATLLEIKSKMLLPRPKKDEGELIDPREELINKLIEYKRFKIISGELRDLSSVALRYLPKLPDAQLLQELKKNMAQTAEEVANEALEGVTLDGLYKIFEQVLSRRESKIDRIRSGFNSVKRDLYSIDDRIDFIRDLLVFKHNLKFADIFDYDSTKMEKVVTFLALLELIKIREICIVQEEIFGDIFISRNLEVMMEENA